jgi:predicted lipid-binding transport protein (Tim44 family)
LTILHTPIAINTSGQEGVVLGPVAGAFGQMSALADLKAEKPLFHDERDSKTVKAYYCRVIYRAWGLNDYHGGHALCSTELISPLPPKEPLMIII